MTIIFQQKEGDFFQQKHPAAATWRVPAGNFPTLQKKQMQGWAHEQWPVDPSLFAVYRGLFYPPVI